MPVISSDSHPVRPDGRRRRASRLGYWIGGGLAAATCMGAAAWVALAVLGLMNQVNGFQRMTVPGTVTVHVPQPGARVLYLEGTPRRHAAWPTRYPRERPGG